MALFFIRHGESEANVRGVHAGQRDDSELTEKGVAQAQAAADAVRATGFKLDRIIASPLKRAAKTAEIFGNTFGIGIEFDDRLLEYDMGLASGMPIEGTPNDYKVKNPEAENVADFERRVLSIVREFQDTEDNVLFVSHGGVGRIIVRSTLQRPPAVFYDIKDIPNCQMVSIETLLKSEELSG